MIPGVDLFQTQNHLVMKQIGLLTTLLVVLFTACTNIKKEDAVTTSNNSSHKNELAKDVTRFTIDPTSSITTYIGRKPTGKHHGKVFIKEGYFNIKEDRIVGGTVTLDMGTITVDDLDDQEEAHGKDILLNHLKSRDFLDIENHPTGQFIIHSVTDFDASWTRENREEFESDFKPLSNTQHIIVNPTHILHGELTLRGVTNKISFPVRMEKFTTKVKMSAKFNIDRTDYNINYSKEASVSDQIKDKFIYDTVNLGFVVEALSPDHSKADPTLAPKMADVFEKKFGVHEGKRRNHITGFCFDGHITINDPAIQNYSKSELFNKEPLKVVGRFSHKGGVKKDESKAGEYGMAFEVALPNGTIQNFSMNTLDFFPVSTPEGFLKLMQAKVSGKVEDFDKLKQEHPEFKNYKSHYKNKAKEELKNYANHQFNSINTFLLEDKNGKRTAVRWSFIPKNEIIAIDTSKKVDFYEDMSSLLKKQPTLRWDMVITIANENDAINDAATMWTGKHQQIVAATLTITNIIKEGTCDTKNFDPLVLQAGFLPSNDPILKFRSPTYATTFVRRLQERKRANQRSK